MIFKKHQRHYYKLLFITIEKKTYILTNEILNIEQIPTIISNILIIRFRYNIFLITIILLNNNHTFYKKNFCIY